MNNNSNPYVTSPEPIVQDATQHGSPDQASINNISSRSNPTRTMPTDFMEQVGHPTKRRKSGSYVTMPPPQQSDQAYIQQGQYFNIPQHLYMMQQPSIQVRPTMPTMQPMAMPSSRNNSNTGLSINRPRTLGYPDNNFVIIPNSEQVIPNQNNQHVSNQIISPQIGFSGQMQINGSQQQQQQQHLPQQYLEMYRSTTGNVGQIALYPIQQVQQQLQPIHSPLMDNQIYDLSTPNNPNMLTHDNITHDNISQRLDAIKKDITKKIHFQRHCSELIDHLRRDIVYSQHCQDTFIHCFKTIKNRTDAVETGVKVLDFALDNIHRFTSQAHKNQIRKFHDDIHKILSGVNLQPPQLTPQPQPQPQPPPPQLTSQQPQLPQLSSQPPLLTPQPQLQQTPQQTMNNVNQLNRPISRQQQHLQINAIVNPPRIEQRQITDSERANANWISRIIDRAWGHVMLPYESTIANQHQDQQEFINSFYIPHEKFERIWKPETAFPPTFIHPNKLPLTYRLISRKPNNIDDDNKCDWPPEEALFKVQINDSEVKLQRKQRIPIKNNQYSFVGVDKAIDIVQYLVAGVNRIKITQCMCEPCRQQLCEHVLSIEILLKETEEIVLRNARSQTLTVEHGMEIVKRLISGPSSSKVNTQSPTSPTSSIGTPGQNHITMIIDDDCDITVNKMKVSLRCPISLVRITEPAKGQNCRHIGCFDLETYVSVNKKNCKWRCPECNDRVTSETLRIDEYFKKLLKQIPENVNTVELDSSGKWTVVGQDDGDCGDTTDDDDMQIDSISKKSSISSTSVKPDRAIIILDDDDEPETTLPPPSQNIHNTTFVQRPIAMRQSSTPGVPYMQPRPNIQMNDQSQSTTNSIAIQTPPLSARLTSPTVPIVPISIMPSPSDPNLYMETMVLDNNSNKRKTASQKKTDRKSRRKETEVANQDRDNSSSSRRSWSIVTGIRSQQSNPTLSPQDFPQTATQVESPISPISVPFPNLSHPEKEGEEWETEDEQEEVVLDSSTAANNAIKNTTYSSEKM